MPDKRTLAEQHVQSKAGELHREMDNTGAASNLVYWAFLAGWDAGAEQMRERAAQLAHGVLHHAPPEWNLLSLPDHIRALTLDTSNSRSDTAGTEPSSDPEASHD